MSFAQRLFTLSFLSWVTFIQAQNTVGVITYEPEKSYPGYNLVFPHGQGTVWLIDACGEVVNRWEDDRNRVPGNAVYLQDNGDLLVCYNRRGSNNDPIWAGGGGQFVELKTWDNELIWSFELNDSLYRLHHDVVRLPNGNVLMIAWENKTPEDAIEQGRAPDLITEGAIWPDFILEYDPDRDSIVWEWHAWDHLVQELDPEKQNFGVVAEHPELIHINHIYASGQADWMHANAIDYHPDLDLIMLSVPHFDEIWIIDHSTTTEEARSHQGGLWGKGGDLVYRWGNPRAYHRGDSADQKLFFTHDCQWVQDFLEETHPLYNRIALFNNRFGVDFSAANILTPGVDTLNRTFGMVGDRFGPEDYDITLLHPVSPQKMYSPGLSSIQVLPNGNYLILNGRTGYAFEITSTHELVWEYIVPIRNGVFIPQGETALNNNTFRMKRYPDWYSAFEGKDLTTKGYMELDPDTMYCDQLISQVLESTPRSPLQYFPNPATHSVHIKLRESGQRMYYVYDTFGRILLSGQIQQDDAEIALETLAPGLYTLVVERYNPVRLSVLR